jgi:hypothetical protein
MNLHVRAQRFSVFLWQHAGKQHTGWCHKTGNWISRFPISPSCSCCFSCLTPGKWIELAEREMHSDSEQLLTNWFFPAMSSLKSRNVNPYLILCPHVQHARVHSQHPPASWWCNIDRLQQQEYMFFHNRILNSFLHCPSGTATALLDWGILPPKNTHTIDERAKVFVTLRSWSLYNKRMQSPCMWLRVTRGRLPFCGMLGRVSTVADESIERKAEYW